MANDKDSRQGTQGVVEGKPILGDESRNWRPRGQNLNQYADSCEDFELSFVVERSEQESKSPLLLEDIVCLNDWRSEKKRVSIVSDF